MNKENFLECERQRFAKLIKFRLPHKFMKIGIVIVVMSILLMFVKAFGFKEHAEWLKLLAEKTLLIGMLMMSISKDKVEDEMTIQLRSQSYMFAFILGVVYALVMPYVEFGVSNVVHDGGEAYKDLGDFQILLFMLMIQLMFYHNLKRYR
ncbi:MAG: hypothetical protein R2812_10205 [Gelidibacter sp.]